MRPRRRSLPGSSTRPDSRGADRPPLLSLATNYEAWTTLKAVPSSVLAMVKEGITLPWTDRAVRPNRLIMPNYSMPPAHRQFIDSEISSLLAKGCLVETAVEHLRLSSPLGVVVTPSKMRLVVNFRHLNSFCQIDKVRFEGYETLQHMVQRGDYLTKVDIKAAYHAASMHASAWPYLGIEWAGRHYSFRALPFGLSVAPGAFTKIVRPLIGWLRARGHRVLAYLDDFIVLASSPEQARASTRALTELLERVGFVLALDKCVLEPVQRLTFLGFEIDTICSSEPMLFVPPAKQAALLKATKSLSRAATSSSSIPARRLARWVGLAASLTRAIIPARALLRNLQGAISTAVASHGSWAARATLGTAAMDELAWWLGALKNSKSALWVGRPIKLPTARSTAHLVVTTDASEFGYGATLQSWTPKTAANDETTLNTETPDDGEEVSTQRAQAAWPPRWKMDMVSSNERELTAVLLALQSFRTQLRGKTICVRSDNSTTVAAVQRVTGGSTRLNNLALRIANLASSETMTIWAIHVPGVKNKEADLLSRQFATPKYEWSLAKSAFAAIQDKLRLTCSVDRFAALHNHLLPRYNSRLPDPAAEAQNALAQSWSSESNFVNAPFRLLPQILSKIKSERATAIVIAPMWPGAHWMTQLAEMSSASVPVPMTAVRPAATAATPWSATLARWSKTTTTTTTTAPATTTAAATRAAAAAARAAATPEPLRNPGWQLRAWKICFA